MILIANRAAILLGLISFALGVLISEWLGGGNIAVSVLCASIFLVVLDLGYRHYRELKLLGRGPAVFWIPLWIWGVLTFIGGVSDLLSHR